MSQLQTANTFVREFHRWSAGGKVGEPMKEPSMNRLMSKTNKHCRKTHTRSMRAIARLGVLNSYLLLALRYLAKTSVTVSLLYVRWVGLQKVRAGLFLLA